MADERELIVLDVDEQPVIEGTGRANSALAGYEKKAASANQSVSRAFEQSGETVVRVTNRSQNSLERLVASAEKKAAFAGLSGVEKLAAERDQLIRRLSGEQQAIDRVRTAYDKLLLAEEKTVSVGDRIKGALSNPLQAASQGWEAFVGKLGVAGVAISAAVTGIAILGKGLLDLTSAQGKAAEQTLNFADRLGITVDQAQDLQHAADIAGVGIGGLDTGVKLLAAALEDTSGAGAKSAKALRLLGVSQIDLQGNQRELGKVFFESLEALSKIENQSERVKRSNELLGKGGVALQPLIKNLDQLLKVVLQLRLDPAFIDQLGKADDKFDIIGAKWQRLKGMVSVNVGVPLLDKILATIDRIEAVRNASRELEASRADQNTINVKPPAPTVPKNYAKQQIEDQKRGAELQEQYAKRQVLSIDAIENKLKDLKQTRNELDSKLGNKQGTLLGSVFEKEKQRLAETEAQIARLEVQKKSLEEVRNKPQEAEKKAHDLLNEAMKKEYVGLAEIIQTYRIYRKELGLTANARRDLASAEIIRIRTEADKELRKNSAEAVKVAEDEYQRKGQFRAEDFRKQQDFQQETLQIGVESTKTQIDFQQSALAASRESELRGLEGLHARTEQQKLSIEGRKLEIEERFLAGSFKLKAESLNREQDLEISSMEAISRARGVSESDIASRRNVILQSYGEKGRQLEITGENELAAVRDNAHYRSAQIMIDANQAAFDRVRGSFESLLDQMFSRTKSFGDIMKSILSATLLTPLKQFSSAYAAALLTGQKVALGPGGQGTVTSTNSPGGGLLGLLGIGAIGKGGGGLGGLIPTGGIPGIGGSVPILAQPTFGRGSAAAQGGGLKSLLGGAGSLKDLFFNSGSINMGGLTTTAAGIGGIKGGLAGFGSSTGAALLGGGLAFDGLRRGGLTGLAETTVGGAAIGFKFGGPIGAAIGAGVGAAAGLVRLFIKGAVDKTITKVRTLYGLNINKDFASQLVDTAKSQFAGNVDLAIRSPQVRDLLELYAMSTGQKWGGAPTAPTPVSLYQSGGSVFQAPVFKNGSTVPSLGGSIPSITVPSSSSGQMNVTLQLDGEATRQVLQGQAADVMANNPRLVQSAVVSATQQSAGRRELAALTLSPGLVTS